MFYNLQNTYFGVPSVPGAPMQPSIAGNTFTQWTNVDTGNQGPPTMVASMSSYHNPPQIVQGIVIKI